MLWKRFPTSLRSTFSDRLRRVMLMIDQTLILEWSAIPNSHQFRLDTRRLPESDQDGVLATHPKPIQSGKPMTLAAWLMAFAWKCIITRNAQSPRSLVT